VKASFFCSPREKKAKENDVEGEEIGQSGQKGGEKGTLRNK